MASESSPESGWLIVGLGNPGPQYEWTPHNLGFLTVDRLAERHNIRITRKESMALVGSGRIGQTPVILAKPQTFMNLSGKAVAQALQWTGCDLAHTIIIYDELDLNAGALRIRAGGGHGGHNGLKSIGQSAGLDFIRIRIGIGRPLAGGEPSWDPEVVAAWVLGNPNPGDRKVLEEAVTAACDAVECIMTEGVDPAASRFNRK